MSNQNQKPAPSRIAGSTDFVICMDVTGSMDGCIDGLKKSIRTFVDSLTAPVDIEKQNIVFKITDWQGKIFPFRDLDEDMEPEAMIDDFSFVNSAEALKEQLDDPRVVATGGGASAEESALDAVFRAANCSWPDPQGKKRGRFIILFSDQPTKPLHTKTIGDIPLSKGMELLEQQLRQEQIFIIIVAPTCTEYSKLIESLAMPKEARDASKLFAGYQEAFDFFNSDSEFKGMLEALAKSVSISSKKVL